MSRNNSNMCDSSSGAANCHHLSLQRAAAMRTVREHMQEQKQRYATRRTGPPADSPGREVWMICFAAQWFAVLFVRDVFTSLQGHDVRLADADQRVGCTPAHWPTCVAILATLASRSSIVLLCKQQLMCKSTTQDPVRSMSAWTQTLNGTNPNRHICAKTRGTLPDQPKNGQPGQHSCTTLLSHVT